MTFAGVVYKMRASITPSQVGAGQVGVGGDVSDVSVSSRSAKKMAGAVTAPAFSLLGVARVRAGAGFWVLVRL